ncbi:branched-chain amino acid ABC transporter permease [Nocardioides sp.]|uniref:branched-chain amino acid ABC transporter permease n=1 Tax=Nocardioides sp. TaxID=35761 RepID=UPI0039E4D4EE
MHLWDALIQGLLIGGRYTVTGLGLMLIFGVLRLVNLAHGEFVLIGGYLAYVVCGHTSLDPLLALPVVALLAAAGGWALHRGLLSRLTASGPDAPVVATFGIALLLQAAFSGLAGNDAKTLPASYADSGMSLLGVRVQTAYVIVFAVGAVCTAAVWWAIHHTRWGMAVRASGRDPVVVGAVGIDVRALHATVFALATGLAAIGGVMVGISSSFNPSAGASYLVFGFAVVVLGGLGNVSGMFFAALGVGVLQAMATEVIGGEYRDLLVYLLLLLLLAFRPQGLMGKVVRA